MAEWSPANFEQFLQELTALSKRYGLILVAADAAVDSLMVERTDALDRYVCECFRDDWALIYPQPLFAGPDAPEEQQRLVDEHTHEETPWN